MVYFVTTILYFYLGSDSTYCRSKDKNEAGRTRFAVIAECKNKDEIADLCSSFNVMRKYKQLIEKNKKEQEALKKSELKLMQAQLIRTFYITR